MLIAAGLLYVTYEGSEWSPTPQGIWRTRAKAAARVYLALGIVVTVYVVVAIGDPHGVAAGDRRSEYRTRTLRGGPRCRGTGRFHHHRGRGTACDGLRRQRDPYGNANLAYTVAKTGEMPADFARGVWRSGTWGLVAAAALTCLFVVAFPLSSVGQMASMAFLIVYGAVSFGHLRVRRETGARAPLLIASVVLNADCSPCCSITRSPKGRPPQRLTLLLVLVASFAFEYAYRRATGRRLRVAAQ